MRVSDWSSDVCSSDLDSSTTLDLDHFASHVRAEHLPHALIIDCSGSDAVAERYAQWLAAGIHVVTPNKHAGSGSLQRYQAIRAATNNGGQFRYEATVGAGLPVIQTLRNLLDTGDVLTDIRSEEHTSELQSLMRISYAVFCLKKKKKHTHIQ